MNKQLRENVQGLSESAINMLSRSMKGQVKIDGPEMGNCIRIVNMGLKVEHMDQLYEHNNKSLALRLMAFLPKDEGTRRQYIEMTNPELKPILSMRPKIENKK